MKKVALLIVIVLFMSACNNSTLEVNGERVDTSKMVHEHCSRVGTAGSGVTVSLNYELYYTGEILNIIESEEKVETTQANTLDLYEKAYRNIHKNYEGLDYYDAKVERTDNSVLSHITINYDKIDIGKLISIEGEDDNVFENKIPKVSKWKELAKKVGTKCSVVEE